MRDIFYLITTFIKYKNHRRTKIFNDLIINKL